MEHVEVMVVGAGVVGLAIARQLSRGGRDVIVLEAQDRVGTGVSSRNSEVIHAGLYYAADSLKARLCVQGRRLLYDFCQTYGVGHRRCGKLVVATTAEEMTLLEALTQQAQSNGVEALSLLTTPEARRLEPELSCVGALHSQTTGIVDSHGLMNALWGDAQAHGAQVVFNTPLLGAEPHPEGWQVNTGGPDPMALTCRWLITACGLSAQKTARALSLRDDRSIPPLFMAKGHYFALRGRCPFSRLIYPMPAHGGLGVHLTLDLAGQAKFGPDVQWLDSNTDPDHLDFEVEPSRQTAFEASIRSYWPALPPEALVPAYSGVRPKLHGPNMPAADFVVQGPEAHGMNGLIQLFGIESPGLTASLALGQCVEQTIRRAQG